MPTPLEVADAHRREQVATAADVVAEGQRLWRKVEPRRIRESWSLLLPELLLLWHAAQLTAATRAEAYVSAVLAAQGAAVRAVASLRPGRLAGIASDGRPLASLLMQPAIAAVSAIGQGAAVRDALTAGGFQLETMARTQVADAGRVADGVATTSRPEVTGYVRMLTPPSCSRCVILAGQFYRWNAGFDRHPNDDCIHIPANEDVADDARTDPKAYFDSLTEAEQDRTFTRDGAEAIRDGADINRVVNARRGMNTAGGTETRVRDDGRVVNVRRRTQVTERLFGRDMFVTHEAVTRRGVNRPVRLMPEGIYELAGNRDEALRLLRVHGYII